MNNKIVIAHAIKNEAELHEIKKSVKKQFPGDTIIIFNYYEFTDWKAVMADASAIIISGFGRVISGKGISIVLAARRKNIPVYFIMKLNNDGLDDYKARMWAYNRANTVHVEKPIITELTLEDERYIELYGDDAIILPTYAV